MARRPATFRQADLARAIKGAVQAGMVVVRALIADSGPSRTPIPTHRGQRSGDRGQFLTMVQA